MILKTASNCPQGRELQRRDPEAREAAALLRNRAASAALFCRCGVQS